MSHVVPAVPRLVLAAALLWLLAAAGGCAMFTPGETSRLAAAGVTYRAEGGVKIESVDANGQVGYRVTCPVCGHVTEVMTVAAPAPGQTWSGQFDCPNCFYSGAILIAAAP